LSEFKTVIPTKLHGLFHAYFPALIASGPIPNTLSKWDELLSRERIVAIGGSDSHAIPYHLGPLSKIIFPYDFHFRTVNTHVLLEKPLSGDADADKQMIYAALAAGHCFVGYDLSMPTRGFRFTAHGRSDPSVVTSETVIASMGDEISSQGGVTLQAHLPYFAEIKMIKDGRVVQSVPKAQALTYVASEPGVYRVEAWRRFLGRRRGWIFSNPIYVR
jgi:hypothetical protein